MQFPAAQLGSVAARLVGEKLPVLATVLLFATMSRIRRTEREKERDTVEV